MIPKWGLPFCHFCISKVIVKKQKNTAFVFMFSTRVQTMAECLAFTEGTVVTFKKFESCFSLVFGLMYSLLKFILQRAEENVLFTLDKYLMDTTSILTRIWRATV
jgi:hypothetical protein